MNRVVFCVLSCILLLFVSSINGTCKRDVFDEIDYNTTHFEHELRDAQRIYPYSPKSAAQPSSSNALKFMTFNMQSGFLTTCATGVPSQASFMQGQQVDFCASEEVVTGVTTRCNCNMPQQIADATGMHSVFGMTVPYGTGLFGTNTATSQNILETRNQLLNYAGVEQRMVVAVRTQPAALKGRNLWFATCHVEYYNNDARYSQISQITQFLNNLMAADPKAVVVAGGDFNGGPWDQGYTTFKNAGFTNSWETYHGSINDGNTIPADYPGSRFDHIWYKAPAGVSIAVTSAYVPDVRLSDHRPYVATLSFLVSGSVAPPVAQATQSPVSSSSSGTIVCAGPIYEGGEVTITCPSASQVIKSTMFANYGLSSGTCQAFTLGTCIGGASTAVVNDKCVGKNTCTFPISNAVFGDPCPGYGKNFRVQVKCG